METEMENLIFEFDLPNFDEDEIDVDFYRNRLIINATRHSDVKEKSEDFFREEKLNNNFSYETSLPEDADISNARVDFSDSILRIIVPRG